MGGVGDFSWIDSMIDEFGVALTKAADETIQKSKLLWKEFTKDIFDDESIQDSTEQLNNGKSGEEHSSSLEKPVVDEVKENPIQQEDEEEKTVSQSSEKMSKFSWGSTSLWHNPREYIDSTLKLFKDTNTSSEEEEEGEITVSKSCENMSELEDHNEEYTGLILKLRGEFKLLNDRVVKSHGEDEELCKDDDEEVEECNSEVMKEVLWKTRKCDSSRESLVVHDDEDDVSDKLEGFVDVRQEENANNNTEFSEDPEFDWVFVTRD